MCKTAIQAFRSLVIAAVAGSVLLQPLYAADSWSRVKKIRGGTWVYVYLAGEKYKEGSFLSADSSAINIRVANEGLISLDRDLVLQVAVKHSGRRWYSVPLAIAAGVAGGAGGYGIAERATCVDTRSNCSKARGVIIGGLAVGSAAPAYGLTRGEEGKKVIYEKER